MSTYLSLPVSGIDRISVFIPIAVGFGVGFFAGLLGAGGGFLMIPILIFVIGVPTTVAIGTDLLQIIIVSSVGAFLYSLSNHVDLVMVVIMLAAASMGAQLGAVATRYVEVSRIRILYGIVLLSGAVAVGLEQASKSSGSELLSTAAAAVLLGVSGIMCGVIATLLFAAKRAGPALGPVEGQKTP